MKSELDKDKMVRKVTLDDLPPELLFKIVGFLGRKDLLTMTRVNRKLREVAWDPILWRSIEIDLKKHSFNYIKLLSEHCRLLKDLRFTSPDKEHVHHLPKSTVQDHFKELKLFYHCEFLAKLDLEIVAIDDEVMEFVVNSFRHLKELAFTCAVKMTKTSLIHISNMKSLEKLNLKLYKCKNLSDAEALKVFTEIFKNLKEIRLNVQDIFRSSESDLIKLIKSQKDKLKMLCMDATGVSDLVLKSIAECKNLDDLCIWYAEDLTNSCLALIAKLEHLRTLELGNLQNVSSEGLVKFFCESASLSKLETLSLFGSKLCDVGLSVILKNCPNLQHLDLGLCRNLTDCGIHPIMENCKHLKSLEVCVGGLSVETLLDIPRKLPKLRKLCLCNPDQEEENILTTFKKESPNLQLKVGDDGAGHFVNMVHNGIEYSHVQLLSPRPATL